MRPLDFVSGRAASGRSAVKECCDLSVPFGGKVTILQNRLEGGPCGHEKPREEGILQETWREMVNGGGLREEGEPGSPQQQQRRGQKDLHGSGFQDVKKKETPVSKKETMCVRS